MGRNGSPARPVGPFDVPLKNAGFGTYPEDVVMPRDGPRSAIPGSHYATSWACSWTIEGNGLLTRHDLELLEHVNCSYLSSDMPPTLLALKQHAQSLTILVQKLSVSTKFGVPNAKANLEGDECEAEELRFRENEALDWLNDLGEPYTNDDPFHHIPLWSIHNDVMADCEIRGPAYHCPFREATDFGPLASRASDGSHPVRRPHMSHLALAQHANDCLEILDHEYSAVGGLMGLLPATSTGGESGGESGDASEMAGVTNTLLGQWLLHQQHLVGRMHELEIGYANALDALADEAAVPLQLLSRESFERRTGGRDIAYPQDRYVLVNAGSDATRAIHGMLDVREREMEEEEQAWGERGVSGDRMWEEQPRTGDEAGRVSRGLVHVDRTSRFYRVKGRGHESSIFLLPAVEERADTRRTLEAEKQPTVVTFAEPRWPTRVSAWEKRFRSRLEEANERAAGWEELVAERDGLRARAEAVEAKLAELKGQLGE